MSVFVYGDVSVLFACISLFVFVDMFFDYKDISFCLHGCPFIHEDISFCLHGCVF